MCTHCCACVHCVACVHSLQLVLWQIRAKRYREFGATTFRGEESGEVRRSYGKSPEHSLGEPFLRERGRDRPYTSTQRKLQLPKRARPDAAESTTEEDAYEDDVDIQDPSGDDIGLKDCGQEEQKSIAPRQRATMQHNAFLRFRTVLEDGIASLENRWHGGCTVWSIAKQELCKADATFRFMLCVHAYYVYASDLYSCVHTNHVYNYVHMNMHTFIHVLMNMHTNTHACTHAYVYILVYIPTTYMDTYICTRICTYVCAHACTRIYVHMNRCMYTCVRT